MTTAGADLVVPRPEPQSGSHATAWWGMVSLIFTEASLFALLIFSYFYLRLESPRWPPEGIALPSFTYIIPGTVLLLGSGGFVVAEPASSGSASWPAGSWLPALWP